MKVQETIKWDQAHLKKNQIEYLEIKNIIIEIRKSIDSIG